VTVFVGDPWAPLGYSGTSVNNSYTGV